MEKVYCETCVHFKETIINIYKISYECINKQNTKTTDTWKNIIYSYPLKPKKINKYNNCNWYEEHKVQKPPRRT